MVIDKDITECLPAGAVDLIAYAREPEYTSEELQSLRDGREEHVGNEEEAVVACTEEAWPPY